MISPNDSDNNGAAPSAPLKIVKAMPTSPVYAVFDIVEFEGKQLVAGQIAFTDQFGMERVAKTGTDLGVLNLGKHILAIFQGQVDISEPDEETKVKLAAAQQEDLLKDKAQILNAYIEASKQSAAEAKPAVDAGGNP